MKILIIKFRNIGDVLLTAPLISSLKQTDPDNSVCALVKSGTEAMLQHHPDLDELLVLPKRRANESKLAYLLREIGFIRQLRAKKFDLVINTTEGDHGALIGFFSGIKHRIGIVKASHEKTWHRILLNDIKRLLPGTRHTVIRNLDLLPDAVNTISRNVSLGFSQEDTLHIENLLRQQGWRSGQTLIQIHPTSRWFFKCWHDQGIAHVIDHLQSEHGLRVVLTAGPEDKERQKVAQILSLCKTEPLNVAGELTLPQTAALSALCKLYIGVDTAPMHMAAALNVPVIAIFGPSGAFDWGPWPNGWQGEATPYPKQNGVQYCGQHVVIQQPWSCVPCGRDGCEGSKRSRCLDELSSDEVITLINAHLKTLGIAAS